MTRQEFYDACEQTDWSDSLQTMKLKRMAGESLLLKVIYMQWEWHHERGTPRPSRPME